MQRRKSKRRRQARRKDWRWRMLKPRFKEQSAQPGWIIRGLHETFLPFHLIVQHILVRLPLRNLCRLRCVSKAWYSRLTHFIENEMQKEEYWFVYFEAKRQELTVYNMRHGVYHPTPMPGRRFLDCFGIPGHVSKSWHRPRHCLASAGGLMCGIVHGHLNWFKVIVLNCVRGSTRLLPSPGYMFHSDRSRCDIYMALDSKDPSRYYVMLAYDIRPQTRHYDRFFFEIFDSKFGCWKVGQLARAATMKSSGGKVAQGDFFYEVVGTDGATSLQAYHVGLDAWSTVRLQEEKYHGECCAFLKFKGRLLKSAILPLAVYGIGFGVWELRIISSDTAIWVEVAKTPKHLLQTQHFKRFSVSTYES